MNRISRFIYAALVVFSAVACHTSEIDNPNKDNPDKPQITDNIQLTASIKQTRVEYSINGEKLEQKWTVGDAIYGFYGRDIANKIVFSVESVDEDTGVASLKPESGWSGFLSAFKANNSLPVGLVYTGCTTSEIPPAFQNYGTIEVDMTSQGTERIPACMHANNFSSRTEDDVTYVTFLFENDCSIIEVFGLTGTSESESITGDSAKLASIQVSGLIKDCSYTLNTEGGLTFISGTTTGATTVTLDSSKWSITKDGDIIYNGDIKPVFIAAVPFKDKSFTVSAKLIGGINNISVPFDNKTFVGGNSYYIMASPVVARTADGVYFKTVTDAFEHADDLYHADYNTAAKNIVTLVRDCGLAGVEPEDGEYKPLVGTSEPIEIDGYDVTLDLNGKTLELDGDECFHVNCKLNEKEGDEDEDEDSEEYIPSGQTASTFNITDYSASKGVISSESEVNLINSFGNVNIGKCTINCEYGVVNNLSYGGITAKLIVNAGAEISSSDVVITNYGDLTVNGGELLSEDSVVENHGGTVTVNGGELVAEMYAIGNEEGDVNIHGGTFIGYYTLFFEGGSLEIDEAVDEVEISSESDSAIISSEYSETMILGGYISSSSEYAAIIIDDSDFTMKGGTVSGIAGAISLSGESTGTITGGYIESKGEEEDEDGYALYIENSTCTISGGTIKNESTKKPAIYCFTGVDDKDDIDVPNLIITWTNGENEDDGGPLVYSSTQVFDGFKSFGAVSTCNKDPEDVNNDGKVDDDKCNWAIVEISGGYLYSSDDAIYSIAGESKVERPDGTYFYTNEASNPNNNEPHYFDFKKTAGHNLVPVQYLDGTSITDPVLGTLIFEYKIIPGEGPDVDTNITGGSLGPFDKIYF